MTARLARIPLFLLALAGCYKAPTSAWQPVRVSVVNQLAASVTVVAGGTTYGSFAAGRTGLAFPPGTTSLTWTPVVPLLADSTPVLSDLKAQTVPLAGATDTVTITNVAGGKTYFTPWLVNLTSDTVEVGLLDSAKTRLCVSMVPSNFQLAYYLLTSTVEIRVYRKGTGCTGTSLVWNNAALSAFQANSGLVTVTISTLP